MKNIFFSFIFHRDCGPNEWTSSFFSQAKCLLSTKFFALNGGEKRGNFILRGSWKVLNVIDKLKRFSLKLPPSRPPSKMLEFSYAAWMIRQKTLTCMHENFQSQTFSLRRGNKKLCAISKNWWELSDKLRGFGAYLRTPTIQSTFYWIRGKANEMGNSFRKVL